MMDSSIFYVDLFREILSSIFFFFSLEYKFKAEKKFLRNIDDLLMVNHNGHKG